jgi:glycerophosphoryl diester phosphodiesterase
VPAAAPTAAAASAQALRAPQLQAHRGGRARAPENTLAAFRQALALGVDVLELDTCVTRDAVVVVTHDCTLNPDLTRDERGLWLAARGPAFTRLDLAEVKRYDVGRIKPDSAYARRYAQQQPKDGERIPTLAEVLALLAAAGDGARHVGLNVEIKSSPLAPDDTPPPERFAALLLEPLRASGMLARSTIQSFDWRALAAVQRLAPEARRVYLSAQQPWLDNVGSRSPQPSPWTGGPQLAEHKTVTRLVRAAAGADRPGGARTIWSPFHGDLTPEALAEARALGLEVVVWTVNDAPTMERMIDWGVDGIITDDPTLLREVMARRGLPLPPPVAR